MSLEMIANPGHGKKNSAAEEATLCEARKILIRCGVVKADNSGENRGCDGNAELSAWRRSDLLDAAWEELRAIRRYLMLWHVMRQSFWHRDERGILKPYLRLRHRQAFHDGICIAMLGVAVRRALLDDGEQGGSAVAGRPEEGTRPGAARRPPHARALMRIATAIAGDSSAIAALLKIPLGKPGKVPERGAPPVVKSLRTRRWPRQCSTRSWQAAYNLACAYAAIADDRMRQLQACREKPEDAQTAAEASRIEGELRDLVGQVVTSLESAVSNPECEMERPWEWIANDPDFGCLRSADDESCAKFRYFLTAQKKRDYPLRPADEPDKRGWRALGDVMRS